MKRDKLFIGLLLLSATISGCKKDFLTLYPEGNLNEGNFYKSTTDFQQGVNGAYVPLRDIAAMAFYMDENRADNTMYDYNSKDRGNAVTENLENFMDAADNPQTFNRYKADYNGISRTNVILSRLPTITFEMVDSVKNQIIGETKALRAHYYFDLVRNYGGVPLQLTEVRTASDAYKERSSAEEVYAQIVADLKSADSLLAPPTFAESQTGRITKGTVETELGAVYLQQKNYAAAIPYLTAVTKMGYSLYPNFRDVFDPGKKNGNKEIIFDVQYQAGTTGQSSNFIYRFTPITTNTTNILGVNFNNTIGGWNMPTQDLVDLFEPGDTRLDASIGVIEGTIDANTNFVPSGIVSVVNYVPKANVVAKYFTRKYFYPPYQNLNQNTDQNWPLYRYSGVLLMLAECLNETGSASEALPYLNQVRTRAFGTGKGQISETGQQPLRDIIARERRFELAFENKRYQDLIRSGQAVSVLTAYGIKMKAKFGYLLPQAYNVTKDRLLYPIPLAEIQLNPKLVQNLGY